MDTVLQKAAELGAQRLVPLITRRTVVRPRREREDRQLARWRAIVLEAAQQSEQTRIPDVEEPRTLDEFLAEPSAAGEVRLMLWEDERDRGLRDVLDAGPPPPRATLLVGPEGGFDSEEARLARSAGFATVSLGDAILRAETAGPVALALLQYAWGDLGRRPRGDAD
jgi:16S rRNA (uracil1498-N3)-methyltransferase